MPILLDGNNLLHQLPRGARSRHEVRKLVLESVRHERMAVTVVFDGPPPTGSPPEEALGAVTVVYGGAVSADDVIIGRLPTDRTARQWVVVTDDRGLADRARQRGAAVRRLAEWHLKRRSAPKRVRAESKLSSHEVAEWETYFGGTDDNEGRG